MKYKNILIIILIMVISAKHSSDYLRDIIYDSILNLIVSECIKLVKINNWTRSNLAKASHRLSEPKFIKICNFYLDVYIGK